MAASFIPYAHFGKRVSSGAVNLTSDTFYAALVSPSYTPQLTDTVWQTGVAPKLYDVAATGNYATGGIALAGLQVTNSLWTVSDTHLDVYKRQSLECSSFLMGNGIVDRDCVG